MTEKQGTSSQPAPADDGNPAAGDDGRIPRPAIWVVAVGLVASLAIYGLSFLPGSGSVAVEWDSIEAVETPATEELGSGSFRLARTSLSALSPNDDGLLLYRVAGVIRIDSGGRQATRVRCDVTSRSDEDTRIARSTRLRAAWPKPSDKLQNQPIPETSIVKFELDGNKKLDLPIRDVLRFYTNSAAETLVDWDGYVADSHNWIWTMADGTGTGTATLPWAVIFEAEDRPKGSIECLAKVGPAGTRIKVPFRLQEWPIADDQPNVAEGDAGDVTNVE